MSVWNARKFRKKFSPKLKPGKIVYHWKPNQSKSIIFSSLYTNIWLCKKISLCCIVNVSDFFDNQYLTRTVTKCKIVVKSICMQIFNVALKRLIWRKNRFYEEFFDALFLCVGCVCVCGVCVWGVCVCVLMLFFSRNIA